MSIDTKNIKPTTLIDKAIGKNLRAIRLHRKIGQQELGKRIGVSFQQVQKYENGNNRITLSRAVEIADVLECDVNDFLTGVANPPSDAQNFWSNMTKIDQKFTNAFQAIACPVQRQAVYDLARTLAKAED